MPSPFSGDPTLAESPSPVPGPEQIPIGELPIDSDPPNGATFAQAYKTLLNFVAWLGDKFAIIGNWGQAVERWRNAREQVRFFIDHNGLPGGKIIKWTEDWSPGALNQGASNGFGQAGAFSVQNGRWKLISNSAGGATSSQPPGVLVGPPSWNISNTSRCLNLKVDGGASGNFTEAYTAIDATTSVFTDDACFAVDFDFQFTEITATNWVLGIVNQGEDTNAVAHGIFLFKAIGTLNFQCRTIDGGSPTSVATSIAGTAGVDHHLRIEFIGASVSDDSTAHAIFYLDNNPIPVANITTTLPQTGGPYPAAVLVGGTSAGGVSNSLMLVGPIGYTQITGI